MKNQPRAYHGLARLLVAVGVLAGASPSAGSPPLGDAAVRADVAKFRSEFLERDVAFSATARQEAERRLQTIEAQARDIDGLHLGLAFAQIAALADNGHTLAFAEQRAARLNRVPVRMVPFGSEFYVVRARAPDADLLGARLVGIDDSTIADLRRAAHALVGGLPAWRDRHAPFLFESPEALQALSLIRSAEEAAYYFELADGRRIERRLRAEPPGAAGRVEPTQRLLMPEVQAQEDGWIGLLPRQRAPWWLQQGDQILRWTWRRDLDALVVQMRLVRDAGPVPLARFYDAVVAATVRHRPRHLVLDLRANIGGDLTVARDFVESLPTRVPGRLFVLTSPWTFSAAISLTGYLKQAAPDRVTIVGEAVGDRLEFFAEGTPLRLDHSKELLLPATERHDYRNGCRAYTDCHAPVRARPIRVESLAPDIAVPLTVTAYRDGRDVALEAVSAALHRDDRR